MIRRPYWLLAAFALLAFGVPVTAGLFDTGELAAAAWELGGSHPPGQPLHALLAHAAAFIPLGSISFRMALPSLVGVLGTCWVAFLITERVLEGANEAPPRLVALAPHAAALGLLFSPPLLRQATRVEVYGPALCLISLSLLFLVDWARGRPRLPLAALSAGLGAALHPPLAIVPLLVGALFLVTTRRDAFRSPALLWATLSCVLGLAVFVYLPIRGSADVRFWGDPTSWEGFVDYVGASAYPYIFEGTERSRLEIASDAFAHIARSASFLPFVGLALFPIASARRGGEHGRLGPLLAVAALLAIAPAPLQPFTEQSPDYVAYLTPALVLLFALGSAGFALSAGGRLGPVAAGVALVITAANPLSSSEARALADGDQPVLETLGSALTEAPPPRALVVTTTDFAGSTWLMARAVDGARPDVAIVAQGLITSSWHWRWLAAHPAYDGTPIRGEGRTPPDAYLEGAVAHGSERVAVAAESSLPLRVVPRIDGVYLLAAEGTPALYGERLMPVVDGELDRDVMGDHDVAGAVVRRYQVDRMERLARLGRGDEVPLALGRALHFLPASQRSELEGMGPPPPVSRIHWVRDPDSFLVSKEDLVRYAARRLAESGEPRGASTLLEAQLGRGDARALLQLGWLSATFGDVGGARSALMAFDGRAPELAEEGLPLHRWLDSHGNGGAP